MSILKNLFGGPKIPPPAPVEPLPPIPEGVGAGVSAIRANRERVRRASGGRPIASTTSGVLKPATTTGLKTLLGA